MGTREPFEFAGYEALAAQFYDEDEERRKSH
jgi:hypothetical protein